MDVTNINVQIVNHFNDPYLLYVYIACIFLVMMLYLDIVMTEIVFHYWREVNVSSCKRMNDRPIGHINLRIRKQLMG